MAPPFDITIKDAERPWRTPPGTSNALAGAASPRAGRRLDPGGPADAARLAVGEGAAGGGDHVGGAVDVLGDRAGRVAHRRGHLGPAQPAQHGGDVLDLRE